MNNSNLNKELDSLKFFEAVTGLYLILNPELTIHAVTDDYLKLKHKSRNKIIGNYIFDEFPTNHDISNVKQIEKLKQSLDIVITEKITNIVEIKDYIYLIEGQSEARYWKIENSPLLDENGEVTYIIQKIEDITKLVLQKESETDSIVEAMKLKVQEMSLELSKLKEQLNQGILEAEITNESLRKNKDQLKLITDAMPVLISYIDREEIFRFNNRTYQEWFGLTPNQIYGKHLREVAGEQFYKIAGPRFRKALSGETVKYEAIGHFPTAGTRHVKASYIPHVYDNKVVGCFTMVEDISKEKEIEEKLIRQNEELKNFAYIASHDLQEPLRMISGYSQLLAKRYKNNLDEQANEFINFILDGSKRMKVLIEDILSHSKIVKKENNLVLTDLNIIMTNVKSNLKLSIEETNTDIIFNDLPTVKTERTHMLQLFQNLISNSIKYSHKDILPIINISAEKLGSYWLFSVKDNGIGISPENFENIFVIFKRLHSKSEYEGTGIGLANCKKIVEIYGGKIWVESEEGQGSTFFFTLPI